MKRITLLTVALLLACGLSYGQETEEESVEYTKLKVLEPLIGTWQRSWTWNDIPFEGRITYSWTVFQKNVIGDASIKRKKPGDEPASMEWKNGSHRVFFAWNHQTQSIERYRMDANSGVASVSTVVPKGEGVFSFVPKSYTAPAVENMPGFTLAATEDELTLTISNRKDATGAALDDIIVVLNRVKSDDDD